MHGGVDTITPTHAAPSAARHSYVLTRRRIYILPTRHGLSFCAVAFVMLIGAINYNNSLDFSLTFLLGSLVLVSMLHTYRNLAGLSLTLAGAGPIFCGSLAHFILTIDHRKQHGRHDICVSFNDTTDTDAVSTKVEYLSIAPDTLAHMDLHPATTSRGWHRLRRVTVSTRFPLGLFRAWCHLDSDARTLVYPQPHGEQELPLHTGQPSRSQGSSGQGSDDFSGLQNYVASDSTRRIHWKTADREQPISVKVFTGASSAEVQLRWIDTGQSDTEARLSQLTKWVAQATQQNAPYSLQIPGETFPASINDVHRRSCLRALALFAIDDDE